MTEGDCQIHLLGTSARPKYMILCIGVNCTGPASLERGPKARGSEPDVRSDVMRGVGQDMTRP